MIGAIAGDIIGSKFEFNNHRSKEFNLFTPDSLYTDDSILTVATMDSLLYNIPYDVSYKYWGNRFYDGNGGAYCKAGYGQRFKHWLRDKSNEPYNSFGNGSAMRVSPVAWAYDTKHELSISDVIKEAGESASVTHDHAKGVAGAVMTATLIYIARTCNGDMEKFKNNINVEAFRKYYGDVEYKYSGDLLNDKLEDISKTYKFDVTCQGTVPLAYNCFVNSMGFEDAIRNAVMVGGDTDTLCAIVGGIAEAFYGIPDDITEATLSRLDPIMKLVITKFYEKFVFNEETKKDLDNNGFYHKNI